MKIYTLLVACWGSSAALVAQQLPIFGQYRENHALLNPASPGTAYWTQESGPNQELGVTQRSQWSRLDDAPVTTTARYEGISTKYNSIAGINLERDKTGPTGTVGGQLRYAFLLLDGNKKGQQDNGQWLSIGVATGYTQYQYRGEKIVIRDPGDVLARTNANNGFVDFNAGVFYASWMGRNDRLFYCGFSVLNMAARFSTNILRRVPHFYGHVGLYLKKQDSEGREYFVEPSAWVRYVPNTPVQADLSCRFHTPASFWVGMGESISVSTAKGGKFLKFNNLLLEAGITSNEEWGDFWEGKQARLGVGYHRTSTDFGVDLGSTIEINLTTAFSGR